MTDRVEVSNNLKNLLGMKRREHARQLTKQLEPCNPLSKDCEDVYQQIREMTDSLKDLKKGIDLQSQLSDILTEAFIDVSSADFKNTRQI